MTESVTTGPADGELLLLTSVEGKAARLGHALTLRVEDWSCTTTFDGQAPTAVTLTAQLPSLSVVKGSGGVKPLSDKDKRTILTSAGKTLGAQTNPTLSFTSTSIDGTSAVHGTVDLHGTTRPIDVTVSVQGDQVQATTTIRQTDFGITPYSQMLGALQVGDDVEVRLAVTLQR